MPELRPQTRDWLNEATEAGFQNLVELYGFEMADVHKQRVCRKISRSIVYYLQLYHDFTAARTEERAGWQVDGHAYVVVEQDGVEFVDDPSWQQFLPEALQRPTLPRSLVGTREEVAAAAVAAGVDPFNIPLWLPVGEYEEPSVVMARHPSNRLNLS